MATGTSVTFIHVLLYFFKILFSSQNLVVCIFLNCISCWYWERIFQIGDFPLAYVSSHTLEKTSSSKSWWNALLLKRLILTLREECCRPCLWRDPLSKSDLLLSHALSLTDCLQPGNVWFRCTVGTTVCLSPWPSLSCFFFCYFNFLWHCLNRNCHSFSPTFLSHLPDLSYSWYLISL